MPPTLPSHVGAIIVAGGNGTRLGGGIPKQFQLIGGRPMLLWSLEAFATSKLIKQIVLVAPKEKIVQAQQITPTIDNLTIIPGGETRTQSVAAGMAELKKSDVGIVLIHDAARPGLDQATINLLIETTQTHDAAAPALPVSDALKRQASAGHIEDVDRSNLMRVQTPQAFKFDVLVRALESNSDAVDDLALLGSGAKIALVAGNKRLEKVTYREDIQMVEILMGISHPRVGTGYDVHAFAEGNSVTLCGVPIPHTHKLSGHSDADVGWHALTDAILGAIGQGDIGDHFPPSDPQWKGVGSIIFLKHAVKLAAERGYKIGNADLTVICESPKIGPHRRAMVEATASALNAESTQVSVKATTTEKLGFTGRKEGIAAQASVLLVRG